MWMQKINTFMHVCGKFLVILISAFVVQCVLGTEDTGQISENVKASVKRRVDAAETVGMVVGVIDGTGQREYFCHGTAGLDDDRPVNEHSVYEIGSISKVFTCTVLADMVLEKTLNLFDPAGTHLPPEVQMPSRNDRKITLEHLATHTSALPRMPANFKMSDPNNPYADYTIANMYDFLSQCTLERDIGSKYEYSNLAMGLLGHILSLKAGMSYEEMIVERIAQPLEMESTVITLTPDLKAKLAKPHNAKGEVFLWDLPSMAGAGAIRSSADDMLTFLAANMGLIRSDLRPAMEMAHKPRAKTDSEEMAVGLGWHIRDNGKTKIVWHNGGTGGFRTFAGFIEEKKMGVIVLSNMNISADDIGFHLLDNAYDLKKIKFDAKTQPQTLDKFEGKYEIPESGKIYSITRRGYQLVVITADEKPFFLFPKSETEFKIKFSPLRIFFQMDAAGSIKGMTLKKPGEQTTARRIQ
jgi:D-alanyl-D-alanine-carboxypeptidase/D-alanyl-D-alanine-endopeptidase